MNEVDSLRLIAIEEGGQEGFRAGGVNAWLAYIAELLTGEPHFGTDTELLEVIVIAKGEAPARGYHALLKQLARAYDAPEGGSDTLILAGIAGDMMIAPGPTPTVFYYLRPDGVSRYLRPDGVSFYTRSPDLP